MWEEIDGRYFYKRFHTADKADAILAWCKHHCKEWPYYSRQLYDDGRYEIECEFTDPDDAAFFRMKWG